MRNKRGELTTQQLVVIIVLIVSFIIILFLLLRLNLGEISDKEICRNSVLLQETSKITSGPLDCRTGYFCISGGGDCADASYSKVEVDPTNKTSIFKALAEKMSDCWWQFGEGEVEYQSGFTRTSVFCGVCSVVEFDDSVQNNFPSLGYYDFYNNYLRTTPKDSTQTYLGYLYDVGNPNLIKDGDYFNFNFAKNIATSEKQSIITGVDMNLKILFVGNSDRYLSPFIVQTSDTSSTQCDEFVTKA